MIGPLSAAVATSAIVVTNTVLTPEKKLNARLVIGSGVYLIGLAAFAEVNEQLAGQIALLVLLVTLFTYGPNVMKKLGVI